MYTQYLHEEHVKDGHPAWSDTVSFYDILGKATCNNKSCSNGNVAFQKSGYVDILLAYGKPHGDQLR
jgi:hypothetical protein